LPRVKRLSAKRPTRRDGGATGIDTPAAARDTRLDLSPNPYPLDKVDFSQDELFDTIDRLVNALLERAGVTEPPVDALHLAEEHLGIPVEVVEPVEEDERGRPRPRPRPQGAGIFLSPDMGPEQQQKAAADGVARALMPDVLRRLGVAVGSESRQFATHLRGLIAARLLVPTRMLRGAASRCKYDLPALKRLFATATTEAVALRLLDLDEPCVIAVVDDGVVAQRRGNRSAETRKLTAAEQECVDRVTALDLPHRARRGGWTAQGWPVPDRPFRRVIVRAVPDDV
jgi:predicted transcriptional regulator